MASNTENLGLFGWLRRKLFGPPAPPKPKVGLYARLQRTLAGEHPEWRTPAEASVLHDLGYTVLWLALVVGVAIISVFALALAQRPLSAAAFIGLMGLIALASGAVGGALGFLFGIPQTLTREDGSANRSGSAATRANTNLEQVSDWLTKIVLGASLVEVKSIGQALMSLGDYVEEIAGGLPGLEMIPGVGRLAPVVAVLFGIAGFLTLYLQTRTFLAIMFERTANLIGKLGSAEVDVLRDAARAIAFLGPTAQVPPEALQVAQKALAGDAVPAEDPDLLSQRGFAQVVLGRLGEGASTLKHAYELQADKDPELARIAARLLARTDRPAEAKAMLPEVPTADAPALQGTEIDGLLSRMFVSLYEAPPKGFQEALEIRRHLMNQPIIENNPRRRGRLEFYTAAAFGQAHHEALKANDKKAIADNKAEALKAVRRALDADSTLKDAIRRLIEGSGKDNDLTDFRNDPDFRPFI